MAILDESGNVVVKYDYDAWGNHRVLDNTGAVITETQHIGHKNPFRYRGYYYDRETGLYYLKSRYYDPETCRFINMDSVEYADPTYLHGLNLYAYCNNNPIMYVDPNGHFPILALILGLTALVGMGLTIAGVASDNNTLTAVGLTIVAVPALISGVGAMATGATYLGVMGGATVAAGIGTGLFASAEYQESFTGNNWMIDAGMSEGWYNGLMITTATLATAGTIAAGVLTSIGAVATPNQMLSSFQNHPNRWKPVKELVELGRGANKGGISTYTNYLNKWTASKLGIHKIMKAGRFLHGPHFHPWI